MKKYYAIDIRSDNADIHVYGDIVSEKFFESDADAYGLVGEIDTMPESVKNINVYINSYGGEVAAGLAIHSALKRSQARITTYCDGFACSAASVIFMAGDERVMNEASLLMIHNAWTQIAGNADELRKEADDLDKISATAANTYRAAVNISEIELQGLLDAETWISPAEALSWGFATSVVSVRQTALASMDARKAVHSAVMALKPSKLKLVIDGAEIAKAAIARIKVAEQAGGETPEATAPAKTFFNFGGKK